MQTFPVTESTLSAFHLGQFLQERYRLSSKIQCKLFRTGMNHLYLITDGERKFVFRVYTLNWRTKSDVSEELRLLNHLKNNNIQISYAIADRSGECIQEIDAPEGIRYGVLFLFAEGRKVAKFTPQASYHIGVAMAKIHQVTENFALNRITYNATTLLTESFKRTKSFFTNNSDEMTFVEQATDYMVKEYEKVNESNMRLGALHLDIWFDNMHLNGENEVTIFDFDFCGNGWLCHDIAYFLFQLYNTNQDEQEYILKAESFLKGYESMSRITDEEKRIMPRLFKCYAFLLKYAMRQVRHMVKYFLNEDHLKRFIASLKRWAAYNRLSIEHHV